VNDFVQPPDSGGTSEATHQQPRHRLLKMAAWFAAGITVLLLLLAVTATILLNSVRFHAYLLNTVQKQASESLGVPVALQNFTLHFSTLSLDLYGLTVSGANPYPNPPILQVQHANVGIRVVSILHRKWYLDNFRIDQPVVQVFVDKSGVSNIPKPKSSNSKSNTTIFDLGIRHAVLDRGEIFYNDRSSPLSADLHNFDLHAAFDSSQTKYAGKLSYAGGRLVYGTFQPLLHDFDAQFDATPTTLHLTPAKISSGASQIILAATLTNYSNPSVQANYEVTVDGGQLAKIFDNPSIPAGLVRASGSAQYHQVANRSALDALVANGDLTSRQIAVNTATAHASISNIAAHYSLANGDVLLHDFKASLLGGELTAQGSMKSISGDSHTNLNASLRGISLAEARNAIGAAATAPQVELAGVLNAGATVSWGKTMSDMVAHADATINGRAAGMQPAAARGTNSNAGPGAPTVIPIDSAIHATYTAANQQLALTQSYLHTPQTNLTMNGMVGKSSSLGLQLQASDLREIATIANLFRTPEPGHPLQPIDLAGTASFRGNVQGSMSAPHLTGQLTASNLHVNGTGWKVFRTNVDVSPSMASLQHADLEPDTHGRITFNASVGLAKWSFGKTSPIQVDLDATQMSIADLEKLASQQIPVTGVLDTHVSLHGTALNPLGNGSLSLTKITAYDEPVTSINANFSGSGDEAHAILSVQLPAGTLQSKVSVRPKDKTYTAQLTSTGIDLQKIQALKTRNIDASGVLAVNADGKGTFDNPQLNANLQIPSLLIQKQTVTGINLQVNMANHVANATLASNAIHTSIQAKARVDLTGDYLADASLDTQGIPLQPLLATYAPEQAGSVSGETELHATLHGPLKNKNLVEAHVTIPVL
jgi:translocation and assembly module TamB